jgi:radical SAM protein with 4Fe4S-binding SPASM domain
MNQIFRKKILPYRRIEDLSIIHVGEQRVFLNDSSTMIWELIDGKRDAREIAGRLIQEGHNFQNPFEQLAGKTSDFLDTLFRLKLLDRIQGDGIIEAASPRPNGHIGGAVSPAPMVKPAQDICMTAPKRKSKFSTPQLEAEQAPRTMEDAFQELYWEHYYIQKMHLELTYRCNFRCIQCYNTTHAGTDTELRLEEWVSVLKQLSEMGCHTATMTGGEVFVRKDALEILRAACDFGFTIRINTNGSLLDEAMIRKMEPMKPFLQGFDISFYGATPQVHDTLARRLGAYQSTLRAVRLLKAADMNLVAKFITMRDNFDGMEKWENDMRDLGVKYVVAQAPLIPKTNRDTSPMVQILTDEQFKHLLEIHPTGETDGAHFCRPGHIRGAITPDGFVSPCEWLTGFKFGNLKDRSLREIWYAKETEDFRAIFEEKSECPSCELRPGCSRCPARSYLETGNLLHCAPSPRHFAEIRKEIGLLH